MPRCSWREHTSHNFLWPPLDCEIILILLAGTEFKKTPNAFYFIFYCRKVTLTTSSKKSVNSPGSGSCPTLLVSEKILTFSGGLTRGIARDGHWASMPAQKPICHEQTLFMPRVWNNNYKGPSLCGQKTVTARPRLVAAAAGGPEIDI